MLCCWERVGELRRFFSVPDILAAFDRPFQCHISSLHGVPDTCLFTVRSPALHEKWGWSSAAHRWYWPLKVMGVFSKKNTNALSSARMLQTCLNNAEVCFRVKNELFKSLAARRKYSNLFDGIFLCLNNPERYFCIFGSETKLKAAYAARMLITFRYHH